MSQDCVTDLKKSVIFYITKKHYLYPFRVYNKYMIKNFADKETEKVYHQIFSRKLPQSIQKIALRKLIMMDHSDDLNDLRIPPSNHLEALKDDRRGQYSIRINDQYRICFTFTKNGFEQVELVDYHS